jgi:hypothetical protein
MTTVGYGFRGPKLAFLTNLYGVTGCRVYSPSDDKVVTKEIIGWLARHVAG